MFQPLIGKIERRMAQRSQTIQEIKQKMNTVEDNVYAEFCLKIGVKNIREFEERELVFQQERQKKIAEFEQRIDSITARLDFERTKDTRGEWSQLILCKARSNQDRSSLSSQ